MQSDLNPGRVFSFHETLIDRTTNLDANDLVDRSRGVMPRSGAMNDGSHQYSSPLTPTPARGYHVQSDAVMTPLIDA